jgi:divalent metal cation (Fe/Co/Zn/Cd) transporter
VVVWLFTGARRTSHTAERRAQQLIAGSFFILAAYVSVEGIRDLAGAHHASASWVGVALAGVTAPTMPLLARAKRRVGRQLDSSATVKEGAQNMLCAYLSVALLVGLLLNAVAGWWWADPAAALVIAAVALREGRETWRGEGCCDAC